MSGQVQSPVQHRYSGRTSNQGLARGPVSTIEPEGARGINSDAGSQIESGTRTRSHAGTLIYRAGPTQDEECRYLPTSFIDLSPLGEPSTIGRDQDLEPIVGIPRQGGVPSLRDMAASCWADSLFRTPC